MSNGAAHGRLPSSRVRRRRSIGERLGGRRSSWCLVDAAHSHCLLGRFHEHRRSPACDAPRAILQCEQWEALVNAETAARTSQVTHRMCDPHSVRQPVGSTDSESPAFRSDRSSRSPGAAGTRAPDTSTALEGRSRSASLSRWIREARPVRRAAAEAIRSASTVRVANGAFSSCSIRPANSARAYATSSRNRHPASVSQDRWAHLCSIGGPCFEDGLAGVSLVSLGLGLLVPGPRTGHAGEHVS